MPNLTIVPLNRTIDAAQGASILGAILAAGIETVHKCGGEGKCGTCHIFVLEGRKGLSKIQKIENEKLDAIVGVGSKSRLACQALIGTDDVTVELLSFASGG